MEEKDKRYFLDIKDNLDRNVESEIVNMCFNAQIAFLTDVQTVIESHDWRKISNDLYFQILSYDFFKEEHRNFVYIRCAMEAEQRKLLQFIKERLKQLKLDLNLKMSSFLQNKKENYVFNPDTMECEIQKELPVSEDVDDSLEEEFNFSIGQPFMGDEENEGQKETDLQGDSEGVNYQDGPTLTGYRALDADSQKILWLIYETGGSLSRSEMADRLGVSLSHIADRLKILKDGGFVRRVGGVHGDYEVTKQMSEEWEKPKGVYQIKQHKGQRI